MLKIYVICIILLVSLNLVLSQSCREQGQKCTSNYACCGGCCRNGICMEETFQSCIIESDLCLDHYCPADMECYLYYPDCVGCQPQPDCRQQHEI